MVKSCKDLLVWQKSMVLVQEVYQATQPFPTYELYGLAGQMRRAAVSVPSNIAEGQARQSSAEFHHFLTVAYGSLAELDTQVIIARELGYLTDETAKNVSDKIAEVGRMMNALISQIAKKRTNNER